MTFRTSINRHKLYEQPKRQNTGGTTECKNKLSEMMKRYLEEKKNFCAKIQMRSLVGKTEQIINKWTIKLKLQKF